MITESNILITDCNKIPYTFLSINIEKSVFLVGTYYDIL